MKLSKRLTAFFMALLLVFSTLFANGTLVAYAADDETESIAEVTYEVTDATWWSGNIGAEVALSSTETSVVYTVEILSSVTDWGFEIYDSEGRYISIFSYAGSWYYGATGDDLTGVEDVTALSSLPQGTYTVVVTRAGADFTVVYYDTDGTTVLATLTATNTDLGEVAYTHFYAQYGSFSVTAKEGTYDPEDADTGSGDTDTGDSGDTSTDATNLMDSLVGYYTFDETLENQASEVTNAASENVGTGSASLHGGAGDTWNAEATGSASYSSDAVSGSAYEFSGNSNVETLTSTAWWSGTGVGQNYTLEDGDTLIFTVSCTADVDDYAAFSVEIYDSGSYITTGSDGNIWLAGNAITDDNSVSGALSTQNSTIVSGETYTVTVTRSGDDYTITYYDSTNGATHAELSAVVTNMDDTAYVHLIAQVGTYTVTNTTGTGTSGEGLELNVTTSEEFTISMWVNTSQKMDYQPVFLAIKDANNYVTAGTNYNSFASGGIADYNGTWYWLDQNNNSSSSLKDLPIGTWTYVTLTVTADGVVTLYYNGEVLSTQTISGYKSSYYTDMPIFLGINWWNESFAGLMDEVTVYDSALTASEVLILYSYDGDPDAAAEAQASGETATAINHVSVHDPSIIKGYVQSDVTTIDSTTIVTGVKDETYTKPIYFIFGSHLAWAYTWDLCTWTTFTNNISTDYEELFATEFAWASAGDSVYDPSGNLWAPDVIWNTEMGCWCMYMSINGCSWNSSICMLTSDSLAGDWTYVDTIIYSGFTSSSYSYSFENTDYTEVTGDETLADRYITSYYYCKDGTTTCSATTWNTNYGAHAIDPCVIYDEDGTLWMTYGSWSGGIYIIQLDGSTGLRDLTVTYETETGVSDAYMGIKLAEGYKSSGEASYIEYYGGYYYLFVTYGGLTSTGGYNMRVYRSTSITGPYVDESGDTAKYSSYQNNTSSTLGMRLMSYYKWSYQTYAQVAQGHNSVFYDKETDQIYLVYHTRTNDGTEGHSVRVHQLFQNEEGWLVAAPFEYAGETTTNASIKSDSYTVDEIAGMYEVLLQAQSVDYASLEYVEPVYIALSSDGTISGDLTGTWTITGENCYITLTTSTDTYKGVLLTQTVEGKTTKTITFTGVGTSTETAIWGYQFTGSQALTLEAEALNLPAQTVNGTALDLPTDGTYGTTITWTSSDESIIATNGTVTVPTETTTVTLTAVISNDTGSLTLTYDVAVLGEDATDEEGTITVWSTDETFDLTEAVQGTYQYVNFFNSEIGTSGLDLNNGISIEFTVSQTGDYAYLSNILGINAGSSGGLYFTGGSYLGFNDLAGSYFDANVYSGYDPTTLGEGWFAGTDYISNEDEVTFRIEIYSYKYEVYVNDELAYSNTTVDEGETYGNNSIDYYYSVLTYLNSTATEFDLGWGSWWDGGFAGTISNITLKAFTAEEADTTGYYYYQDFQSLAGQTGSGTTFTSASASSALSVTSDDYLDWYFKFAVTSDSGNRGAYNVFDDSVQTLSYYTVEVDTALTAGVLGQRSESEFVILGTDASGYTANNVVSSGYILKLYNSPPSTTSANVNDYSQQTTWYINDSDETVEIPVGTWVHIKADVNVADGTVELTITGRGSDEVLYSGTVEVNGGGYLYGLYLLKGRGVGTASVDNIMVSCYHQWDEGVVTTEATCTEDGVMTYTCSQCGETYTEVIEATGHSYEAVVTEPTCTEEGYTTYTCSVCGDSYVDDYTEAMGHDYVDVVTEPTETEQGYTTHTCSVCGDSYVDSYTDPTGTVLTITAQPEDVTVQIDDTVTFSVTAEGDGLTYQWYYMKSDATEGTAWSGRTSSSMSSVANSSWNGMQVYCIVTDTYGNTAKSESATITIETAVTDLVITGQPESVFTQSGETVTFNVTAEGDGLKYQWYYMKSGATYWTAWYGRTEAEMSAVSNTSWDNMQVYCVVTDTYGNEVYSDAATVTIGTELIITGQPESVMVATDTAVTFSITAEGDGLTYQWYYMKSGSTTWTAWNGRTSATMSSVSNSSWDNMQVRCVITDVRGDTVTSDAATVTIGTELAITSQSTDVTTQAGETVTFSVTAEGDGLQYQWYYMKAGATEWTAWNGRTGATMSSVANASWNGMQVRCVVTDVRGETAVSEAVTIVISD